MIKSYLKLHGSTLEEVLNGNRPTLTAKQFLGKEEGQSYFKQSGEFVTFAKTLRPREVEQLDQLFVSMKEGLQIVGSLETRKDKGGRDYAFVNTRRANATTGSKFILEGGMVPFLKDYMDGKFIIGFTLEELIEEAMNN